MFTAQRFTNARLSAFVIEAHRIFRGIEDGVTLVDCIREDGICEVADTVMRTAPSGSVAADVAYDLLNEFRLDARDDLHDRLFARIAGMAVALQVACVGDRAGELPVALIERSEMN